MYALEIAIDSFFWFPKHARRYRTFSSFSLVSSSRGCTLLSPAPLFFFVSLYGTLVWHAAESLEVKVGYVFDFDLGFYTRQSFRKLHELQDNELRLALSLSVFRELLEHLRDQSSEEIL